MSSLRLAAGHAAIPPGHDDVLGLVLARAVHHGCDPLVAMLVCRRWRDGLLGRAKGVSIRDNAFALLERTPGLLSLTAGDGCTRLPWQVEDRGDVALPLGFAHLSKLTCLKLAATFGGWTPVLRHIAALRGLRCLCVPSSAITSVEALGFLSELTALATLEFDGDVQPSPAPLLSNVLSRLATLPSVTALYLGRTQLQDAQLGPQLGALSTLTRLTAFALEWNDNSHPATTALDCDLSPLSHLKCLAHLGLRGMTPGFSAHLFTLISITTLTRLALCWDWPASRGAAFEVHHLSRLRGLLSLEVDIGDAAPSFAELSALTALTRLSLKVAWYDAGDSGLQCVRTLTALRDLTARLPTVTDDDLASLRALTRLSALALRQAYEITWAGLAHVAVLSGLRRLDLGVSGFEEFDPPRFGAGELPDLSALGALEELTLAPADADDLRCLLSLTGLTCLRLRCAYKYELPLLAGAPFLSRLLALRQCHVDGGIVGGEFCTAVNALPNLESVSFECGQVGPGVLGRLSTPTFLRLEECDVSPAAIASVSALDQLRELHVGLQSDDSCEYVDVDEVAQCLLLALHPSMQLTRIVVDGANFPEAGVRRLASVLPVLRSVEVNGKLRRDIFTNGPA